MDAFLCYTVPQCCLLKKKNKPDRSKAWLRGCVIKKKKKTQKQQQNIPLTDNWKTILNLKKIFIKNVRKNTELEIEMTNQHIKWC